MQRLDVYESRGAINFGRDADFRAAGRCRRWITRAHYRASWMVACAYRKLDSSVAVVQAADHGLGNDRTKPRDRSADRRVLA